MSNIVTTFEAESTYTTALRINTYEGTRLVRLENGLSHAEALARAQEEADSSTLDVIELVILRDRI